MNGILNFVTFLMALTIAAFSLTGHAASTIQKRYSLNMAVAGVDSSQLSTPITAKITNLSPPSTASSNISSFSLTLAPVSGLSITGVDQPTSGTVTFTDTTVTVTNLSPLKGQDSLTLTIHVSGCGDGSTWSAQVWTGSSLTGSNFILDTSQSTLLTNVACGVVACGDAVAVFGTTGQTQTQIFGSRGLYNQDGSANGNGCTVIPYFATNTFATDSKLHFRWDQTQPKAAFQYAVNVPITLLAWLTDNNGSPVFISALNCDPVNPGLPAPYGTLLSDNGGKTIKVDTTTPIGHLVTPTVSSFPIFIGLERLQVTKVNGQTWSVQRGQGGTNQVQHPAGALVMSTPLPILPLTVPPPYTPGDQAQMCISSGNGSSTTVDDIGDGWVRIN